jgi:hypothetical protein
MRTHKGNAVGPYHHHYNHQRYDEEAKKDGTFKRSDATTGEEFDHPVKFI